MNTTNIVEETEIKSTFTVYNMTLTDAQETFSKYSPFQITRSLNTISDKWDWISYSNNDKVLTFKDYSDKNDTKFENINSININNKSIAIAIQINKSFNQVKGVIFSKLLISMKDDDILESLKPFGVNEVYRFVRIDINNTNLLKPTGSFSITFYNQQLPEKVNIAFLNLNVYPLFPKPMQCSHCKLLGHTKKRCLAINALFCKDCFHAVSELEAHICHENCKNCRGSHYSDSKLCPAFIKEKSIIKLKTIKGISYKEAKRRFSLTIIQSDEQNNELNELEKLKNEKSLLEKLNSELIVLNKEQTKSIQLLTTQNEILIEQNKILSKKDKINEELLSKLLTEVKNAPKHSSDSNKTIVELRNENENLKSLIEKDKNKFQSTQYHAMCMKKFIFEDKKIAASFDRFRKKFEKTISSEEEYED